MSDIDLNKVRRLDGGLLLVFRELLRTRRASQAAERLGLSQPAISHALSRLRDLFGDPLFVRRPHGFEPTRRALELAPRIDALIELADEALSPASGFDPAASARMFRMGAPEFVTATIGARLINHFRAVAPQVTFGIAHVSEDDAYRSLRTGELDLALGRFGAPRPGYVGEPLFEDEYCCVARVGHPQVRDRIDDATWRGVGHVYAWSPSEMSGQEGKFDTAIRMLTAVPQWLTVLVLVAQTDGIATVPRRFAERHAALLGLQVLDLPFPPNAISVGVLRRAGVHDPGVDWFLEEVRRAVEV